MPALLAPPPRDQVTAGDADRYELCGEACLASALGLEIESVAGWLRHHEGGERAVHSGTSTQELIDFCRSRGIGAQPVRGRATRYVAKSVARGHYVLVLVWSDHQGTPVTRACSVKLHPGGIGHWLLGYGVARSGVDVMQPWGGRLLRYDLNGGQDQQMGIEIDRSVTIAVRPRPLETGEIYIVKPGDTLSGIAQRKRVRLAALLRANPQIKDPNRIAAGARIDIPR
jgi:LysM repeat protein